MGSPRVAPGDLVPVPSPSKNRNDGVHAMSEESRFPFTKTALRDLPTPTAGRATYQDSKTPGLTLRITSKGTSSFYWYRKVNGQPVRILIGRFPGVTIEQARKTSERLTAQYADGRDPRAERRAVREEPTLADLFAFWMQAHAKPHKRTWEADQRQYDTYLKPWAGRRLSTIRKVDVQALHLQIAEEKGRYIANKVLALQRAMFNRAEEIGFTGPNPTAKIKKFPEEKRDRFLHADELRKFFLSLMDEDNATVRDFFIMSLLTGARKSNVLAMRWAEIDFATGLWRISTTKSGQPVVIPLTGPAMQVLRLREAEANGSAWVFPSHGATGHLVEPKKTWKRIIDRAGLEDVRPHDLRRSLGSWMAITGAGLPIVGKMLGHTQQTTTQIYARLSVDPVREAAERATTAMLAAGGLLEAPESTGAEGSDDGQA